MKRVILPIFLLFAPTISGAAAPKVSEAIATLKAAGPGEAGNAAAREAWRSLAATDASALPVILIALNDAEPLQANWLRSAFDAIAERQLRESKTLPATVLEEFAIDARHAPRPRRLAYEWLTRVDSSAPDRLIPRMLNDPSLEFRRDAVARLIDEATAQASADKKTVAAETYHRALSSARDLDQVKEIVKKLEDFGEQVDIAAHFGYLLAWKLIGPFDNTSESGFDVAFGPETEVDFTKECQGKSGSVRWVDYSTTDPYGKVDLNKAIEKANSVTGYAAAEFVSDVARPAELRLQSMNATKIWLNGKLLAANKIYHAGSQMDQYIARGDLKKGRNLILVKACQNEQPDEWAQSWDFQLRVCDALGTAILSQDRVAKAAGSPAQ